jgi:hypothetical protein
VANVNLVNAAIAIPVRCKASEEYLGENNHKTMHSCGDKAAPSKAELQPDAAQGGHNNLKKK